MSSDSFHVHGPHDHELEHAIEHGSAAHGAPSDGHGGARLTNQIALFTAVIATVGALFSYMGGDTQAKAGIYKNNAAIRKTEAADQWGYYQSKSTKQALVEMTRDLSPNDRKAGFQSRIDRYAAQKTAIQHQAEALEKESATWEARSEEQMHLHHRWAQATTVLQVAIALAAIALLTRRRWLEYAMFAMGAAGLCLGALAMLHV